MTNKVIWITGGSSGIGKALAYKFPNEGWQVAISSRREEILNESTHIFKPFGDSGSFLVVADIENYNTGSINLKERQNTIQT